MWRWSWVVVCLAGCIDRVASDDAPDDAGVDRAAEQPRRTESWQLPGEPKVDLLFVIEATASMCGNQAALVEHLDDLAAWSEQADLRIATVVSNASEANRGAFVQAGPGDPTACVAPSPAPPADCPPDAPVLHVPYGSDLETVLPALTCKLRQGPFDQGHGAGLESMRRALSCDGPNADLFAACCVDGTYDPACSAEVAFLRPDAVLAVVILSDRDDCSAPAPLDPADPNTCVWERDALIPVDTYRHFLTHLKAQPNESLVMKTYVGDLDTTEAGNPIVYDPGPPDDPRCDPTDAAFDPALERTEACCPEGRCQGAVISACESDRGEAQAGHRYRALASALGQPSAVEDPDAPSICADRLRLRPLEEYLAEPGHGFFCLARRPVGPIEVTVRCVEDDCPVRVEPRTLVEGADFTVIGNESSCEGDTSVRLVESPPPRSEVTFEYPVAD